MNRFVTPLKASSVKFSANGVWRGVVTARDGSLVSIKVPRLSGELEYTSVETAASEQLVAGDPVLVGFMEGLQDELVVIGRLSEPDVSSGVTATSTDPLVIDKVPISSIRSVKYVVAASYGGEHTVSEILAVHNDSAASFTEYGVVSTPGATSALATYDVSVSGGVMVLIADPVSAGTVFTISKVTLVV